MLLETQILPVGAIVLAVCLAIYLKYKVFEKHMTSLVLFGLTGIPDALATVQFAYLAPEMEANPVVALFLGHPYLIVLGIFLWTFTWLSIAEFFERKNLPLLTQLVLLGLFVGHGWGFSTWLHRMNSDMINTIARATIGTLILLYYIYIYIGRQL